MKIRFVPALILTAVTAFALATPRRLPAAETPPAGPPDFRALLRDALFDEEASRDLEKAAAGYEALLTKWSEQRSLAASALFRLAEVRRKQDRKADAIKLYQRLLAEFPDMDPQSRLSRENLAALGVKEPAPAAPAPVSDEEAAALARVQKLATESPDLLTGNEFTDACEKGLLSVVKFLHSKGVRDTGAGMAQAAGSGRLAVCTELLAQSPPADHLARGLAQSLAEQRLSVFKLLLEKGGDASAIGWNDSHGGRPLLTGAILWESQEMVDLLLAHKAAANAPESSTTTLFAAAYRGNAALVKRLLELGADPSAGGTSPDGHAPPRRAGVGVSTPDKSSATSILPGCTPLHAAVFSGSAECVSLLLAAKADPNAANEAGWTPLHSAAKDGSASAIGLLLAAGANPNGPPAPDGEVRPSPLWLAIDSHRPASVAALLKGKADPNLVYGDLTPAAHAITLGDEKVRDEMLALLLANGADPTLGSRSAIREAPTAALRVKLLRDYQYPKLKEKPEITLVFASEARESVLAVRTSTEEVPAGLAPLLVAWHDRGGWKAGNAGGTGQEPDWSKLRLFRIAAEGKMGETIIPIGAGAEFPALQWGDVFEITSKDATGKTPSFPLTQYTAGVVRNDGLPPATLAVLRDSLTARIKLTVAGVTRDLTLRGSLRTWNPLSTEAPLVPLSTLADWGGARGPGNETGQDHWVVLQRHAGGSVRYPCRDAALAGIYPRDGDEISIATRESGEQGTIERDAVGFTSPGQAFGGVLPAAGDTTLFTLLGNLYAAPPAGTYSPGTFNPDGTPADPGTLHTRLADPNLRFRVLPHPDFSRLRFSGAGNREGQSGPGLLELDLLKEATALGEKFTPAQARALDIPLPATSIVTIPTLPDAAGKPWTALPPPIERLLSIALMANIQFDDRQGNVRAAFFWWHPARYCETPAGVLPIPFGGDPPEGFTLLPALLPDAAVQAAYQGRYSVDRIIRGTRTMAPANVTWLRDRDIIQLTDNSVPRPQPVAPGGKPIPARIPVLVPANVTRVP